MSFNKFSAIISSSVFSVSPLSPLLQGTDDVSVSSFVVAPQVSEGVVLVVWFFLCCSDWVISVFLPVH